VRAFDAMVDNFIASNLGNATIKSKLDADQPG
jgi:hypothetical protein